MKIDSKQPANRASRFSYSRMGMGIALASISLTLLVAHLAVIRGGWTHSTLQFDGNSLADTVFTSLLYICTGATIFYLLYVLRKDRVLSTRLEERNQFIENVASVAPAHLYLYDVQERVVVYANNHSTRILGYSPKELHDMGTYYYQSLVHPDDLPTVLSNIQEIQLASDAESMEMEYRMRHRDGRWIWMRESGRVFRRNSTGDPELYIGAAIDVSEARDLKTEKDDLVGVLLESESRFRAAAEASLDGLYLLRAFRDRTGAIVDFEFVFVNATGEKLLNLDGYTIIGKKVSEVEISPRFIDLYQTFLRVIDTAVPCEEELTVTSAEGVLRVFQISIVVSGDGVAVTLRDDTERAESGRQLRLSEERYELATRSANMAVWEWDLVSGRVYNAPVLQEILGYSDDEFPRTGDGWAKLLHPDDAEKFNGAIHDCVKGLTTEFEARCRLITASGSHEWIVSRGRTIRDEVGNPLRMIGTTMFITADVARECDMAMMNAAVMHSGSMVVITDDDARIEYVNPQFTIITGYTPAAAIGKRMNLLKSGVHDEAFYKEMWTTIKSGKTFSAHMQNKRSNGSLFWLSETISPITDSHGRITHFVTVGQDITEELGSRQKLAEAEKLSATGMLAAGVAHEFKNYLAGIMGNASYAISELESGADAVAAKDTLEKIVEIGDRANEIVMSLLSYSKAQVDQFVVQDVTCIVGRTVALVGKEMEKLSIELTTSFKPVPPVNLVPGRIQQILLNLIINARDAIQEFGTITIVVESLDNKVLIKVGDSGMGIAPEVIGRIFDPFFSTKGVWGKDKISGTGMGLAIARNIARDHGGDLVVESILGLGTTFTLLLPVPETSPDFRTIPIAVGFDKLPTDPCIAAK